MRLQIFRLRPWRHSSARPWLATLLVLQLITAHAATEDEEFLSDFVVGKYSLIGRGIDTNTTYSGTLTIHATPAGLRIERRINGKTTHGTAAIETALHGEAHVLRIRFEEKKKNYEESCLVNSDLDNYARLTCYLYRPGEETKHPGLEAFFIDSTVLP